MLKRLGQIELAACVALLAIITGLVFVAALMRFFGHPLIWSVDMAQLLFMWLCMLGSSRAMREKTHIGMEMLVQHLGYRRQFWLEMILSVVVLAFLAVLVVEGYKLTMLNRERTFGDSTLSYAWVTAAVPVGSILVGASLAYNMVTAWLRRREGMLVYSRTPADGDLAPPFEV